MPTTPAIENPRPIRDSAVVRLRRKPAVDSYREYQHPLEARPDGDDDVGQVVHPERLRQTKDDKPKAHDEGPDGNQDTRPELIRQPTF